MKQTKIEDDNGYPEAFQRYSHDPYLGKQTSSRQISITTAGDNAPVRPGITIRERLAPKIKKAGRLLV